MTRSEINELLRELGFYMKTELEDEVPEEFRFSPAKDSPFKEELADKPAPENASSESNTKVEHTDL